MSRVVVVSIHDVAPATLDACCRLRDLVRATADDAPVSLLVVPALHGDHRWPEAAAQRVRAWRDAGDEVVMHGWEHRDARERDGAEFTRGMPPSEVAGRLRRGRERLAELDLPADGFVAPAYGHPRLLHDGLARAGFEWWATRGRLHCGSVGSRSLPSVGLGASTRLKRQASPIVARAGLRALAGAGALRLDLHPADMPDRRLRAAARSLLESLFEAGREPVRHADLLRRFEHRRGATISGGSATSPPTTPYASGVGHP